MEAKLKSIIRLIPWSSLLKAALIAALRLFLVSSGFGPGALLFATAAVLFYFVPFFRPKATFAPFLITLILALLLPQGIVSTLAVFLLFGLLFGLKDLDIVDRATAYEVFVFLALFAAAMGFFHAAPHWGAAQGFFGAVGMAILFFTLVRRIPWEDAGAHPVSDLPEVVSAVLTFEIAMALLVLPVEYLSQASILFAFAVFGVSLIDHLRKHGASQRFLFRSFGAFALLAGFILALSNWKI